MSHEMTWEATVLCTEVWGGAGQSPHIVFTWNNDKEIML